MGLLLSPRPRVAVEMVDPLRRALGWGFTTFTNNPFYITAPHPNFIEKNKVVAGYRAGRGACKKQGSALLYSAPKVDDGGANL